MRATNSHHTLSPQALSTLVGLGTRIRNAREAQSLSITLLAKMMMCTRATLYRVERGDASVSIGVYVAALEALGLGHTLAGVARAASGQLSIE
jgi:transcriptional regulator with XRE-family HTH domain